MILKIKCDNQFSAFVCGRGDRNIARIQTLNKCFRLSNYTCANEHCIFFFFVISNLISIICSSLVASPLAHRSIPLRLGSSISHMELSKSRYSFLHFMSKTISHWIKKWKTQTSTFVHSFIASDDCRTDNNRMHTTIERQENEESKNKNDDFPFFTSRFR